MVNSSTEDRSRLDGSEWDGTEWDVIVVGAGPAGAVAARQLALDGLHVLLVERKGMPRAKVCGACLSAGGIAILQSLGLDERIEALHGVPLYRFQLFGPSGRCSLTLPPGLAISRAALDSALVHAAIEAGVTFLADTRARVGQASSQWREVFLNKETIGDPLESRAAARLVLAADGLGHPSLSALPEFCQISGDTTHTASSNTASSGMPSSAVPTGSRIGAGCELEFYPGMYGPGTVHMAIGDGGYVGLAVVESGRLNVAAALDPQFVRHHGGLGPAATAILRQTGCEEIAGLENADWRGTPRLTRREPRVSAARLLLLGDAAGYAEPFTGEGMTWALIAASAIRPIARRAARDWHASAADQWTTAQRRLLSGRQRLCRAVAWGLKRPRLVSSLMRILSVAPGLARPFIHRIHSPPLAVLRGRLP